MAIQTVAGNAIWPGSLNKAVNTGIVRHAGNLADTTLWTNGQALGKNPVDSSYLLKENLSTGLAKAVTAGTFNRIPVAEQYIIMRVSTLITGIANTTLLSGASKIPNRKGLHFTEHVRTSFLSALSWATTEDLPVYTATVDNQDVTYSNDHAARPTLATPGELVYQFGDTGAPAQKDYEAKTVG